MPGDGRGMRRLVVLGVVKADGKRLYRPRAHRLHQCHDRRRIDAAREQRAEADVGDHPPADRIAQEFFQDVGRFVERSLKRLLPAALRDRARGPVGDRYGLFGPRTIDDEIARGWKLTDTLEDAERCGEPGVFYEQAECVAVDLPVETRMLEQRLELGDEHQADAE